MIRSEDSFILDLVKHGDEAIVSAYFKTIHKMMPHENRMDFLENHLIEIIAPYHENRADYAKMAKVITDEVGIPDSVAAYYLNRYIQSKKQDQFDLIDRAVESLGRYASLAVFDSLAQGASHIAEKIINYHGAFDFSQSGGTLKKMSDGSYEVSGLRSNALNELIVVTKNSDLMDAMRLLKKLGVEDDYLISDDSSCIFNSSRSMEWNRNTEVEKLASSDIPIFEGGIVKNPEMMILSGRISGDGIIPGLLDRIPCWMSPDDAGLFETSVRYNAEQFITDSLSGNKDYRVMGIYETANIVNPRRVGVTLALIPEKTEYGFAAHDSRLINSCLNNAARHGFGHIPGKVLCTVDASELSQFNLGNKSLDREARIGEFLDSFNLLSLARNLYGKKDVERIGTRQHTSDGKKEIIEEASLNRPLMENLIKNIGEVEIFSWMASSTTEVETYINLYKSYGYNNKDFDMYISTEDDLDKMIEAGFRFDENSAMLRTEYDKAVTVHFSLQDRSMQKLAQAGLWTDTQKSLPEDTYSAIKSAVRQSDTSHLECYLLSKGIEDVSSHCKTPAQWDVVVKIFNDEEIDTVRHMMPSATKKRVLESSLDL